MDEKTGITLRDDEPRNPFGEDVPAEGRTAVMEVESARVVAETQASMVMAQRFPRDQRRVMEMIMQDCTLPMLAEHATYDYKRGTGSVIGPTIRLAEAIARRWGNLECGVMELSRHEGFSECMSYAWDLQSRYKERRFFQVRHWRDTREGGYALTDERDIYELVANMGARRKRACILALLPPDVVENALRVCEVTLKTKLEVTDEFIGQMLEGFAKHHVTKEMIELRIQRRFSKETLPPAMALQLRRILNSLDDEDSKVIDWFKPEPTEKGVERTTSGRRAPRSKKKDDQKDPPPAPQVDPTKPADASQLEFIRNKAKSAAITEGEICKAFGMQKLDDLRAPLVNAVLKWLSDPTSVPQK